MAKEALEKQKEVAFGLLRGPHIEDKMAGIDALALLQRKLTAKDLPHFEALFNEGYEILPSYSSALFDRISG